jgi:hypothetical protein
MLRFASVLIIVAIILSLAGCIPGSAPAANTDKQQAISFLKSAAAIEKEVAAIDSDMVNFMDTMSKMTSDQKTARMNDLSTRIKAAKVKAVAITKPTVAEAAAFYDKWNAAIANFEVYITPLAKGDIAAATKATDTLSAAYKASDAALGVLLAKYSITKAEVGWPS